MQYTECAVLFMSIDVTGCEFACVTREGMGMSRDIRKLKLLVRLVVRPRLNFGREDGGGTSDCGAKQHWLLELPAHVLLIYERSMDGLQLCARTHVKSIQEITIAAGA